MREVVLGIETSCDDSCAAIVISGKRILSNEIISQEDILKKYGGVHPMMATHRHTENIRRVISLAISKANINPKDIDLISVTEKPGLKGPLLVGISFAKALAYSWNKPLVGVNHLLAHLYSTKMDGTPVKFPAIGIVISGGHTTIFHMKDHLDCRIISESVDDAIGEAFDKVARMLGIEPSGSSLEKYAFQGNPKRFSFNYGRVRGKPLHFSFSGIKTRVKLILEDLSSKGILDDQSKRDLAASFQEIALLNVVRNSVKASKELGTKRIVVSGGVSANSKIRELFEVSEVNAKFPPKELCRDNAAMIAGLGYHIQDKLSFL